MSSLDFPELVAPPTTQNTVSPPSSTALVVNSATSLTASRGVIVGWFAPTRLLLSAAMTQRTLAPHEERHAAYRRVRGVFDNRSEPMRRVSVRSAAFDPTPQPVGSRDRPSVREVAQGLARSQRFGEGTQENKCEE